MSSNTNTSVTSLYQFVLQQIAAESYFEGIDLGNSIAIKARLRLGTNRPGYTTDDANLNECYPGYTRMASQQADEFLSKYSIVHQWSDNPTPNGSRPPAAR